MKITTPEIVLTVPRPATLVRWSLLPLLALALVLVLGHGATAQQDDGTGEAAAGASPDFSIRAVGDDGVCTTADPDDTKCRVMPGEQFTVTLRLDKLAGLASYTQVFVGVGYSSGLTRVAVADECAAWPDGGLTVEDSAGSPGVPQLYIGQCDGAASTHTGALAGITFECPAFKSKETVTLVSGTDVSSATGFNVDTFLAAPGPIWGPETHAGNDLVSETLVINCTSYFPWDVHGPNRSANLDGYVDLPNDILGVILHYDQSKPVP